MSHTHDLRDLLESWPFDPSDDVRIIRGSDGRQIMQVRLPLGIEQYEMDGRPDGLRPHGMESALEFQLARLAKAKAEGREAAFALDAEDCVELFNEGVLYYYRYVRCFQIKDWPRTVRDTARNLRVFDLVKRYAEREEDRLQLEQWRPYVLRMNAVARAMMAVEEHRFEEAMKIIGEAAANIESLEEMDNPTFKFERERSLTALRELAQQLERDRPLTELERLQRELQKAIESEQFERAARLRDRIKALRSAAGT
ncbi:MAG: UvrB/UvrC motif-containing protein [Verrucomicrobiae bacterium]|nr:UvrB/UvrC motif-containing protein [Verrucomicrobiae bacterium]